MNRKKGFYDGCPDFGVWFLWHTLVRLEQRPSLRPAPGRPWNRGSAVCAAVLLAAPLPARGLRVREPRWELRSRSLHPETSKIVPVVRIDISRNNS